MKIENYSRVILLTDMYLNDGVKKGAIGYVIERYPNEQYEVEFSDGNGISIAQIVVGVDEISLSERRGDALK